MNKKTNETKMSNEALNPPVTKMQRPRRLRKNPRIRTAVAETLLHPGNLVQPLFVAQKTEDIKSMPGQKRLSLEDLKSKVVKLQKLGLFGVALFSKVEEENKDALGTKGLNDQLYFDAIRLVKEMAPELQVITDIALDPYSSHGHDGIMGVDGKILNDETCEVLVKMALKHAELGADFVAPSDMMDGRVGDIRLAFEQNGYEDTGIISYSVKYASAFYGPFRDALDSAPKSGDKKTYQMDPANSNEALKEAFLDLKEGADVLMVKPAGLYLDILQRLKDNVNLPLAAYQVSGEYSALCAAFERGWLNRDLAVHESLISIRRAGAQLIFSYFSEEWAEKYSK